MPQEPDLQVDGAFFHHRAVDFTRDSLLESFDITNNVTSALSEVGLYRHGLCLDGDGSSPCFLQPVLDNRTALNLVSSDEPRQQGFDSGDVLVDFIFNHVNRVELHDEDAGEVSPGLLFYKTLAEQSPPVTDDDFFIPELATDPVPRQTSEVRTATYCCHDVSFFVPERIPVAMDFGPVCELTDPQSLLAPEANAVGSDGTEYVVLVEGSGVAAQRARTVCDATQLVLEAHLPRNPQTDETSLGPPRWHVALPIPAGFEPGGACRVEDVRCEIDVSVEPQPDGSVRVTTTTSKVPGGVDGGDLDLSVQVESLPPSTELAQSIVLNRCCVLPEITDGNDSTVGTVRAWVDASGHPGFDRSAAAAVPNFSFHLVEMDDDGNATLDPCAVAPEFGCDPLPAGETVQWLFGDGTVSDRSGGEPTAQEHRYPRVSDGVRYLGTLVHYGPDGHVVHTAHFRPTTAP